MQPLSVRRPSFATIAFATIAALAFAVVAALGPAPADAAKPNNGYYVDAGMNPARAYSFVETQNGKIIRFGGAFEFTGGCIPANHEPFPTGLTYVLSKKLSVKPKASGKFSFEPDMKKVGLDNLFVSGKFKSATKARFFVRGSVGGCQLKKKYVFKNARWTIGD